MKSEAQKEIDKHIEFLSADIKKHSISYAINDKSEGQIEVEIEGRKETYQPYMFFEYLFLTYSRMADQQVLSDGSPDLNEKARIYLHVQSNVIQVAERFKKAMATKGIGIDKPYDFSGIYRQIDAPIQRIRLELDIKLLDSQIGVNKSTIEANRISKITNIYIAIFTFIAAEYYCYDFLRNYISDLNANKPTIINDCLLLVALLGIIGYLRIRQLPQLKNKKPTP